MALVLIVQARVKAIPAVVGETSLALPHSSVRHSGSPIASTTPLMWSLLGSIAKSRSCSSSSSS